MTDVHKVTKVKELHYDNQQLFVAFFSSWIKNSLHAGKDTSFG